MKEIQKLRGPQPQPPGSADPASFHALRKYYERVNGFRFPEAELRQQWETTPSGPSESNGAPLVVTLLMSLLTGAKQHTKIRYLRLSFL